MKQGSGEAPSNTTGSKKAKEGSLEIEDFNKLTPLEEQSLKDLDVLKGVNFEVMPGETVAIVGQVASGKSSLLLALLGEMNKSCGSVKVKGTVAYIPQTVTIGITSNCS